MKWLDLASEMDITDKFWKLKRGQTVGFMDDKGKMTRFKVMRIDRPREKFWVKEVKLWRPSEFSLFWEEERKRRAK
jgi:hypothetical protein